MEQATIDDSNTGSYIGIDTIIQQETSTSYQPIDSVLTTTQEQQSQPSIMPMSDFRVPPELQIPLIVLVRSNNLTFKIDLLRNTSKV